MRKFRHFATWMAAIAASSTGTLVHAQQQTYSTPSAPSVNFQESSSFSNQAAAKTLRIGVVNTKKCLENSKLGKQEQANFEKMKQQMETILEEKQRAFEEIEAKLNDDDYMDSISDEAASEIKRKKRTIKTEGSQLQSQYVQTLQQAQMKIIQKLTESISKASALVSKDAASTPQVDAIFTDEACTYFAPHLDVTDQIVAKMNVLFDQEQKENGAKPR